MAACRGARQPPGRRDSFETRLFCPGEIWHGGCREIAEVLGDPILQPGGQAFFPTSIKELDGVYDKIMKEITARYTLGYTSTDERADGAWRPVEIKVKRPDLKGVRIRTRPGYYAPGSPPSR